MKPKNNICSNITNPIASKLIFKIQSEIDYSLRKLVLLYVYQCLVQYNLMIKLFKYQWNTREYYRVTY